MKIIAFSDVHGNQYAFKSFIEEIKKIQYDYIFFCGDIHGYYYGQSEIIKQMIQMKNLYAVKGNHDKIAIEIAEKRIQAKKYFKQYGHSYAMLDKNNIEYVKGLSDIVKLDIGQKKIAILHGTLDNVLEGRLYPTDPLQNKKLYRKYDFVFCGHTHFQMIRKYGHTMIINAGSIGQQRDGKGCCFVYVDTLTGEAEYKNIYYDRKELEAEINKYDPENTKMINILYRGEK